MRRSLSLILSFTLFLAPISSIARLDAGIPSELLGEPKGYQGGELDSRQLDFLSQLGLGSPEAELEDIRDLRPLQAEAKSSPPSSDVSINTEEARQLELPFSGQLTNLLKVVMQTNRRQADGSLLALDLGLLSPSALARPDFGFDSEEIAKLRPDKKLSVSVTVVVPTSLKDNEREEFLKSVTEAFQARHPGVKIQAKTVNIDVAGLNRQAEKANRSIISTFHRLVNQKKSDGSQDHSRGAPSTLNETKAMFAQSRTKFLNTLEYMTVETAYFASLARKMIDKNNQQMKAFKAWVQDFSTRIKRLRDWKNWTVREKDMFLAGVVVGGGKSSVSVSYWLSATGVNTFGFLQSGMSLFLDVFFAAWGNKVEAWKGSHKFPLFKDSRLVRWYNGTPLLKAFVVGNLISFTAGFYFRLWSHLNNPNQVSSPWSFEALGTYLGAMSIGGLIGSAGGQGALTLRRKGWISARQEMLLYQIYGIKMQVEGFLYGSGMTSAFWMFFSGNMAFQSLVYGASRTLPVRAARVLVLHPEVLRNSAVVESELYTSGLFDAQSVKNLNQILIAENGKQPTSIWEKWTKWKDPASAATCQRLFGL